MLQLRRPTKDKATTMLFSLKLSKQYFRRSYYSDEREKQANSFIKDIEINGHV